MGILDQLVSISEEFVWQALFNPQLHFRREYDCDRLLPGMSRRLVGVCSASRRDAGNIAIDCLLAGFLSALECREHVSRRRVGRRVRFPAPPYHIALPDHRSPLISI